LYLSSQLGNILFLPKKQCPDENQQLNRRGLPASAHTPACQSYGFSIALFMVHISYKNSCAVAGINVPRLPGKDKTQKGEMIYG